MNVVDTIEVATQSNDVALRSNQKLVANNGEYLYLYTNGTYSLDVSETLGKCYKGTYSLENSRETIILTYSTPYESESWSGRVRWYQGKISSITILGQIFNAR